MTSQSSEPETVCHLIYSTEKPSNTTKLQLLGVQHRPDRLMRLDWSNELLVLVTLKVKSREDKLLGGEHVHGGGGKESSLCVTLLPFTAFIYLQREGWTYEGGGETREKLHVFLPCSATPSPGFQGGVKGGGKKADGGEPGNVKSDPLPYLLLLLLLHCHLAREPPTVI